MLGIIGSCLMGIAAIGRAIDDSKSKKESAYIDKNGNVNCYGRLGERYINGERVYMWTEYDKNDRAHHLTIGCNSGKVYYDDYNDRRRCLVEMAEKSKRDAIERGKLAYENDNDPRFNVPVTTEISTGKVIACLYKHTKNGITEYRKFYMNDDMYQRYGRLAYNKTSPGDMGIIITEDEYYKLGGDYAWNVSKLPSDSKVLNELWGTKNNGKPKYTKEMLEEARKRKYVKCIKKLDNYEVYAGDIFELKESKYIHIDDNSTVDIKDFKEYFEEI